MNKEVDTRIVEMRFENSKFEKNVSQTMKSLDRLKEALSFNKVQKSVDNFSFDHLVKSVDKLSEVVEHRSGIMGGVFEELGAKIVNVFSSAFSKVQMMINQVTIDPIATGFSEYELKTNAIQVIAANTGVLMKDAMNEMNASGGALLSTAEAMEYAWDVMLGKYGNGAERVEALGDKYEQVQGLVNQMVAGEIDMNAAVKETTSALEDQEYTMKNIEEVLDDLNTYADKTIYNYAQMTDAIGTFTTQGVDLYDASTAVQGLANLAAFTGTDATSAARVMHEAAKGLSTGFINLRDWMSFETSGGMGGEVFQEQLRKTADILWETDQAYRDYVINSTANANGISTVVTETTESISSWIDEQGRFRESLKGGWLNDRVLIETLHKFANDLSDAEWAARGYTEAEIEDIKALGTVAFEAATKSKTFTQMWNAVTEAAQSSWTESWEYIFGHFYDARNLWTDVSDALSSVISSFNESRNSALKFWATSPFGRNNFLKGISNLWNYLVEIGNELSIVWKETFGVIDGKKLVELSTKFRQFTESLFSERSQTIVGVLIRVFSIFTDTLYGLYMVVSNVGSALSNFFYDLFNTNVLTAVYNILGVLQDFVQFVVYGTDAVYGFGDILSIILEPFQYLINHINFDNAKESFAAFTSVAVSFGELIGKAVKALAIIFSSVFSYIGEKLGITFNHDTTMGILATAEAVIEFTNSLIDLETLPDRVRYGLDRLIEGIKMIPLLIAGAFLALTNFIKETTGIDLIAIATNIKNAFISIFDTIRSGFSEFYESFKSAGSFKEKMVVIFGGLANTMSQLFGGVAERMGPFIKNISEFFKTAFSNGTIASFGRMLLSIFVIFRLLTDGNLIRRLATGISTFMRTTTTGIDNAMSSLSSLFDTIRANSTAQLILSIAAALLSLGLSLAIIAFIPADKLENAVGVLVTLVGSIIAIIGSLRGAMGVAQPTAFAQLGVALVGLGIGMLLLVGAVGLLSLFDYEHLIKGIVAVGVLIAIIGSLIRIMDHAKFGNVINVAVAINLIVGSLFGIIASLALLTGLTYVADITPALLTLIGILSVLTIMMVIFSNLPAGSVGTILASAAAINLIVGAIAGLVLVLVALAGTLELLSANENFAKSFELAIISIGFMFILIIALIGLLAGVGSKITSGFSALNIMAVAVAVNIIVLALYTFVGVLALVGGIATTYKDELWGSKGIMMIFSLMVLYLASLAMIMGSVNPVKVLSTAVAVNIIVGAMVAMATALLILSTINFENEHIKDFLHTAEVLMMVIVLIVAIVAVFRKASGPITNNITRNLIFQNNSFGGVLTGIALIILSIGASLWLLVDALANLIEVSERWDSENSKNKISTVIKDFCDAFIEAEPALKSAQHHLNDLFMDFFDLLVGDLLSIISSLVEAIVVGVGFIVQGAMDALIVALNALAGFDLTTYWELVDSEGENFDITNQLYQQWSEESKNSNIVGLIKSLLLIIALVIEGLAQGIENASGPLVVAIGHLLHALGILAITIEAAIISAFMPEMDDEMFAGYISSFEEDWAEEWLIGWNTYCVPALEKLRSNVADKLWLALVSPLWAVLESIRRFTNYSLIEPVNEIAGYEVIKPWKGLGKLDDLYEQILKENGLVEEKTEDVEVAINNATNAMDTFNKKVEELSGTESVATIKVNPMLADSKYLAEGFSKAGQESAKANIDSYNNALEIHSPSKVYEESGVEAANGFYKGFERITNSEQVQSIKNALVNKAKQASDELLNTDYSGLYDSLTSEYSPNIEGVFHLDSDSLDASLEGTNLMEQVSGLNIGIGDMSTDLADMNQYTQDANDALMAENGSFYDDTEVVNELSGLRSDVATLADAMAQIKMVLDTGVLVGEMVAPMDEALSRRSSRVYRGN